MFAVNPCNERTKRRYFTYLKEALGQSEATIDEIAKSLARFEENTGRRDFKTFRQEQAVAFKRMLNDLCNQTTGEKLSKSTHHRTLAHLKKFFKWLALQPGFKSRLRYSEAEYFNESEKDLRVASAKCEGKRPTQQQVKHVIASMPNQTAIERRDRALVAFILATGARDRAVASLKLKHIDVATRCVHLDAREVETKFSKSFETFFFPVGEDVIGVVLDWVRYLREHALWGNDDPLFPATEVLPCSTKKFEAVGLKREHWRTAQPIREIFRRAFVAAGLPYFNPHSLRNTLVQMGQELCRTPEEFKAWSQNLGHERVLTTFTSYGRVSTSRQAEIVRNLQDSTNADFVEADKIAKAVVREMRNMPRRRGSLI